MRKDFREFIANRYGNVMAEKYQNMFDFTISLDFETYRKKLIEIFTKRQVLY